VTRRCLEPGCGNWFVAYRRTRRYCDLCVRLRARRQKNASQKRLKPWLRARPCDDLSPDEIERRYQAALAEIKAQRLTVDPWEQRRDHRWAIE